MEGATTAAQLIRVAEATYLQGCAIPRRWLDINNEIIVTVNLTLRYRCCNTIMTQDSSKCKEWRSYRKEKDEFKPFTHRSIDHPSAFLRNMNLNLLWTEKLGVMLKSIFIKALPLSDKATCYSYYKPSFWEVWVQRPPLLFYHPFNLLLEGPELIISHCCPLVKGVPHL